MALWGNKDSVYSTGTVDVNLGTNTVTGTSGVVTFTSVVSEGDVITINSENGEIIQTIGLDEALTSQFVVIEIKYYGAKTKAIIVGSSSGKVYCYELSSLELIWENNSAERMIETLPLVIDDKIIYGSWDNYLYCLSKSTGSLIWKWTENKNFYYSPAACWPVNDGKNVFHIYFKMKLWKI